MIVISPPSDFCSATLKRVLEAMSGTPGYEGETVIICVVFGLLIGFNADRRVSGQGMGALASAGALLIV